VPLRPAALNIRTEYILGSCAGGSGDLQPRLGFFCLVRGATGIHDADYLGNGVLASRYGVTADHPQGQGRM